MYLFYLDESGNEKDPADRYFVLGGLAIFERQTYFVTNKLEAVQERHFPKHQPIPFHASDIRAGKRFWRAVPEAKRDRVLSDVISAITGFAAVRLFAAAIEKDDVLWGDAAVEKATEEVCHRFDGLLKREYQQRKKRERGLLIFSTGRFDDRAKVWVSEFRQRGTASGSINNLADIPYFASMQESRLLQAADFVAHAVWLLYEKRDPSLLRAMMPQFERPSGIMDGLVHVGPSSGSGCDCPACYGRRVRGSFGPWVGDSEQLEIPGAEEDPAT